MSEEQCLGTSFALTFLKGEHFILNKCQDVPRELEQISMKLQGKGDLEYFIADIEGMYPAMPKEIILELRSGILLTKYNNKRHMER